MLKALLLTILIFISVNAFACWKVQGTFAVDGETWKIHQKFDHNKEYMFPMGSFILKMTMKSDKNKKQFVAYDVHEKKGTKLVQVTAGQEKLELNKTQTIFAKGLEGQPHSIITLNVSKI